jgi:hypothetical protein
MFQINSRRHNQSHIIIKFLNTRDKEKSLIIDLMHNIGKLEDKIAKLPKF